MQTTHARWAGPAPMLSPQQRQRGGEQIEVAGAFEHHAHHLAQQRRLRSVQIVRAVACVGEAVAIHMKTGLRFEGQTGV